MFTFNNVVCFRVLPCSDTVSERPIITWRSDTDILQLDNSIHVLYTLHNKHCLLNALCLGLCCCSPLVVFMLALLCFLMLPYFRWIKIYINVCINDMRSTRWGSWQPSQNHLARLGGGFTSEEREVDESARGGKGTEGFCTFPILKVFAVIVKCTAVLCHLSESNFRIFWILTLTFERSDLAASARQQKAAARRFVLLRTQCLIVVVVTALAGFVRLS